MKRQKFGLGHLVVSLLIIFATAYIKDVALLAAEKTVDHFDR